ncbi:hypothetical protein FSP39_012751 [Pinctada imbricata]|uniref:Trans-1,2-dihydrobenzene-1,2-diol dehydrogenase n=1 Tax=Pinctada imbricata TaxID=66713 RepID=A0AA89C2E8_PINIB|nr:hypothetical protein FSP39_012751 [Pinctada imbricata]
MDRGREFANKIGIKTSYGSYEELSKDTEVDIVYIATWHTSHVALSKMMLSAGKHVLCEKPMCLNVEQVKEVFQVARERKKFFMEGIWSRTFEIYQRIKDDIQSGVIGDVQLVTASFCKLIEPNLRDNDRGDGMLLRAGLYTVQFANWIFNNEAPESVTARGTVPEDGMDRDGCVILSYKNGAKASLSYSSKCIGKNSATIYGTKGCIQIPDSFWCPEEATLPSGTITYPLNPDDPSLYVFKNSFGFRNEAKSVRQSLMEGKTECPVMSYEDSLALYRILDEIRRQIGLEYDPQKWTSHT